MMGQRDSSAISSPCCNCENERVSVSCQFLGLFSSCWVLCPTSMRVFLLCIVVFYFVMFCCYLQEVYSFLMRNWEGVDLEGRQGSEKLEVVEGGGIMIELYCMRRESIFNKRGEHLLFLRRSRVWFPAPTWSRSICNSGSRGSYIIFWPLQASGMHMVYIQTCKPNTHTYKIIF